MNAGSLQPELTNQSSAVSAAWGDVRPHSHLVQFYEDDAFLIESLVRWFSEGLKAGDSCLFIGTEAHRSGLEKHLTGRGIDLDQVRLHGRLVCLNAVVTLTDFMVDERPNEALFARTIESVLAPMSKRGNIRAFGEMVALLWKQGNRNAAIRLEEIWNTFMQTHALSLSCAYPLSSFGSDEDPAMFLKVCAEHTPVLPAESYSALSTPTERLRAVSLLQHKAKVLDIEKAGREEAEKSLHAFGFYRERSRGSPSGRARGENPLGQSGAAQTARLYCG